MSRSCTHLYHLLLEKAYYLPLLAAALTLGLRPVTLLLLAVSTAVGANAFLSCTVTGSSPLPDYSFTWRLPPTMPMGHENG